MNEPQTPMGEQGPNPPIAVGSVLRCPGCGHDGMDLDPTSARCPVCRRQYSVEQGVIDLAPPGGRQARSVTQRLMESHFYAKFYDDVMRPRLTNVVTGRTLPEEFRLAAEYLELSTATAILDVACGTGNFTRHFAQRLHDESNSALLIGLDISWPMLEVARKNLRREGLQDQVRLVRANAMRFPVCSESLDRVHCAGTLHMVEDIDGALREFARLLQPDGICVIGTFVLGRGLGRRLVKRIAEIPTRFHWFGPRELERRLERVGLHVLSSSVEGDALTVKAVRG